VTRREGEPSREAQDEARPHHDIREDLLRSWSNRILLAFRSSLAKNHSPDLRDPGAEGQAREISAYSKKTAGPRLSIHKALRLSRRAGMNESLGFKSALSSDRMRGRLLKPRDSLPLPEVRRCNPTFP